MLSNSEQQHDIEKTARPPIVVVMGHIDHGKTKLLDTIRKENVVGKEAGGITQHIGAYEIAVDAPDGNGKKKITFIDTPGHEAFSHMRARGAHVADIAILVIATDDGVKPQTVEALHTIKKAGIPFIVALNKIDTAGSDPERVKKELSENDVLVEEWGGKIPSVLLSAKEGTGVDDLLEMIILVADLEDLKTRQDSPAKGVVIESHLDAKRGNTATLLVTEGTLKQGEFIVTKGVFAPVRIFEDFKGSPITKAFPSQPVRIVGFSNTPEIGAEFHTAENKKEAEAMISEITIHPQGQPLEEKIIAGREAEDTGDEPHIVPLVIKADTSGSLEAIEHELKKLEKEKLVIKIIKKGVGAINEDDAKIAGSRKGSALAGFHVKIEKEALALAERFGVKTKTFEIIYELIEWLRLHIETTLPQETKEVVIGEARVIKIFSRKGSKQIVGGQVLSGIIKNKTKVNITRRATVLAQGRILELQHKKTDVGEVADGSAYGAKIDSPVEIAEKDIIQALEEKTAKRSL